MIPIISPESTYKILWDLFLGIARFFLLFIIPLEISFHNKYLFDQLLFPFILIQICLITDLILNFNTAYYEYGQIVAKRSSIVKNYVNNALLGDLASVISFLVVTVIEINQNSKFIEHYDNVRMDKAIIVVA